MGNRASSFDSTTTSRMRSERVAPNPRKEAPSSGVRSHGLVTSVPDNLQDAANAHRKRKGISADNALSRILFQSEKLPRSDDESPPYGKSRNDVLGIPANENDDFGWFQDFESAPNAMVTNAIMNSSRTSQESSAPSSNNASHKTGIPIATSDLLSNNSNGNGSGHQYQYSSHNSLFSSSLRGSVKSTRSGPPLTRALTLPSAVMAPPAYILDCSLDTQNLWYQTAGMRPKQPAREREKFEQMWLQNFQRSEVKYDDSLEDILSRMSSSDDNAEVDRDQRNSHSSNLIEKQDQNSISLLSGNHRHRRSPDNVAKTFRHDHQHVHSSRQDLSFFDHGDTIPPAEIHGEILFRGSIPFSNSVAKSFLDSEVSSITLQIPNYRVVKSIADTTDVFAEFLVKITLGSTTPITFGIWKRHSEFRQFANLIAEINSYMDYEAPDGSFKNSLLSWQCVLARKRWFKSLDREYLTIKAFLLERFLQDVLFESPQPDVLLSFLGVA